MIRYLVLCWLSLTEFHSFIQQIFTELLILTLLSAEDTDTGSVLMSSQSSDKESSTYGHTI